MGSKELSLAGAALLFLAFVVWRVRPGGGGRLVLGPGARAARDRARAATDPRARAEAFCEAATLAVQDGARWTSATGFFLRAMSADPTWPGAVTALAGAFRRRRPRMLEKILWRRLAQLPWDDAHQGALHAIASSLADLYEHGRHDRTRAVAMRKLEATFRSPAP
jgi:hypothetical protein